MVLKNSHAAQTTLEIIGTFTKIRLLVQNIRELADSTSDAKKKSRIQRAGEIITDIFADRLDEWALLS